MKKKVCNCKEGSRVSGEFVSPAGRCFRARRCVGVRAMLCYGLYVTVAVLLSCLAVGAVRKSCRKVDGRRRERERCSWTTVLVTVCASLDDKMRHRRCPLSPSTNRPTNQLTTRSFQIPKSPFFCLQKESKSTDRPSPIAHRHRHATRWSTNNLKAQRSTVNGPSAKTACTKGIRIGPRICIFHKHAGSISRMQITSS